MNETKIPLHRHVEGSFTYCYERPEGQRIVLKIQMADGSVREIALPEIGVEEQLLRLKITQAQVIQGSCESKETSRSSEVLVHRIRGILVQRRLRKQWVEANPSLDRTVSQLLLESGAELCCDLSQNRALELFRTLEALSNMKPVLEMLESNTEAYNPSHQLFLRFAQRAAKFTGDEALRKQAVAELLSKEPSFADQLSAMLEDAPERGDSLALLDRLGEEGVPPSISADQLYSLFERLQKQTGTREQLLSLSIALVKYCDPKQLRQSINCLILSESEDDKRRLKLRQCAIETGFCCEKDLRRQEQLQIATANCRAFQSAYKAREYEKTLPELKKMLACEDFELEPGAWAKMWICLEQIDINLIMARDVLTLALNRLPEHEYPQAQAMVLSLSKRLRRIGSEYAALCLLGYPGQRDGSFFQEAAALANALYRTNCHDVLAKLLQAEPKLLDEDSLDRAIVHTQFEQMKPAEALPLLERLADLDERPAIPALVACLELVLISEDAERGWAVLDMLGQKGLRLGIKVASPLIHLLESEQPGQRADRLRILRLVCEVGSRRCWRLLKAEPIETLTPEVLLQMPPPARKLRGLKNRAVRQWPSKQEALAQHFATASSITQHATATQIYYAVQKRRHDFALDLLLTLRSVPKKERAQICATVSKILKHLVLEENGRERSRDCYKKAKSLGVLPAHLPISVIQYWFQEGAIDLLTDANRCKRWSFEAYAKKQTKIPSTTEPMAVQYWAEFWSTLPKLVDASPDTLNLETWLNQIRFPDADRIAVQVACVDPLCQLLLDLFEANRKGWANEARKRFVKFLAPPLQSSGPHAAFALFSDSKTLIRVARLPRSITDSNNRDHCQALALIAHCLNAECCVQPMELHCLAKELFNTIASSDESTSRKATATQIAWATLQVAQHWRRLDTAQKASSALTALLLKVQFANEILETDPDEAKTLLAGLPPKWSVLLENSAVVQAKGPLWHTTAALLESAARHCDERDLVNLQQTILLLSEHGIASDLTHQSLDQMHRFLAALAQRSSKCPSRTTVLLASVVTTQVAIPLGLSRVRLALLKEIQARMETNEKCAWNILIEETVSSNEARVSHEAVLAIDTLGPLIGLQENETVLCLERFLQRAAQHGNRNACAMALGCLAGRGHKPKEIPLSLGPAFEAVTKALSGDPFVQIPQDDLAVNFILIESLRHQSDDADLREIAASLIRAQKRSAPALALADLDLGISIARSLVHSAKLSEGWRFARSSIKRTAEEPFTERKAALAQLSLEILEQALLLPPKRSSALVCEILDLFVKRQLYPMDADRAWDRVNRWFMQSLTLAAHESDEQQAEARYRASWSALEVLLNATSSDRFHYLSSLRNWCFQATALGPHGTKPLVPVVKSLVQVHSESLPLLALAVTNQLRTLSPDMPTRRKRFRDTQTFVDLLLADPQLPLNLKQDLVCKWLNSAKLILGVATVAQALASDPKYRKYL